MARAQAGDFAGALGRYNELMTGLGKAEQEEFAANFADSLAAVRRRRGRVRGRPQVYQTLLDRYGESPTLRQKVKDDLARLDRVGKPAPEFVAKDIAGRERPARRPPRQVRPRRLLGDLVRPLRRRAAEAPGRLREVPRRAGSRSSA